MLIFRKDKTVLSGSAGELAVHPEDELTQKLAMIYEGQCEGLGPEKAAQKYGYSRQRFYQLLHAFINQGAHGLLRQKTGPKSNYRRSDTVVRQIIRHLFLDRQASPEVVSQKLRQLGHPISIRSVQRIVADYGLQKKTLRGQLSSGGPSGLHPSLKTADQKRTRRSPELGA